MVWCEGYLYSHILQHSAAAFSNKNDHDQVWEVSAEGVDGEWPTTEAEVCLSTVHHPFTRLIY